MMSLCHSIPNLRSTASCFQRRVAYAPSGAAAASSSKYRLMHPVVPSRRLGCAVAAEQGSEATTSSGLEGEAPQQMSVYEVAAANAIKVGKNTDLDRASRALVHKLEDSGEGAEVEVWATGSIMQLAALKLTCKAQSFAASKGFSLKMVPFEEEQEALKPPPKMPRASSRSKRPEDAAPEMRRKVVWVVSKQLPPMDLSEVSERVKHLQLHRVKESWAQTLARIEEELTEEGKAVTLEFMGERPSKVLTNTMLKLFARCQSDDDYLVLPGEAEITGYKDESSTTMGYALYVRRCFPVEE